MRRVVVLMGRRYYQNSPVCSVSTLSATHSAPRLEILSTRGRSRGSPTITPTAHRKVAVDGSSRELERPVAARAPEVLSAVPVIVKDSVVNPACRALSRCRRVNHMAIQAAVGRPAGVARLPRVLRPQQVGAAFRARGRPKECVFHDSFRPFDQFAMGTWGARGRASTPMRRSRVGGIILVSGPTVMLRPDVRELVERSSSGVRPATMLLERKLCGLIHTVTSLIKWRRVLMVQCTQISEFCATGAIRVMTSETSV